MLDVPENRQSAAFTTVIAALLLKSILVKAKLEKQRTRGQFATLQNCNQNFLTIFEACKQKQSTGKTSSPVL